MVVQNAKNIVSVLLEDDRNSAEWVAYVKKRCNELHPYVFGRIDAPPDVVKQARMTYRAFHQELNRLGFGRDQADLPQLQYPNDHGL